MSLQIRQSAVSDGELGRCLELRRGRGRGCPAGVERGQDR